MCEIHENFKFLLRAVEYDGKLADFINSMTCDDKGEQNPNCHLGYCCDCPKQEILDHLLDSSLQSEEVTYTYWLHTDGTDIKTVTIGRVEFRTLFLQNVPKIIEHEYVARKQAVFLKSLWDERTKLSDCATVQVDFAQNYSFMVQNAVQVGSND